MFLSIQTLAVADMLLLLVVTIVVCAAAANFCSTAFKAPLLAAKDLENIVALVALQCTELLLKVLLGYTVLVLATLAIQVCKCTVSVYSTDAI